MSANEICETIMATLKDEISKLLTALIPTFIEEITPNIIKLSKRTIEKIFYEDIFS